MSDRHYPPPPGGHYPPPPGGYYPPPHSEGVYPPLPGSHYPPPHEGHHPPHHGGPYPPYPGGHYPPPESECAPPSAPPYMPHPDTKPSYPLPHCHYPPPPHSNSSSSPSSCPPSPPETVHARGPGYYWLDWHSDRPVPPTAVHGGSDKDGSPIYVGRAFHAGDWLPAKVIPDNQIAYVAYGGGEHAKHQFQILCEQRFDWVPSHGGHIPPGAVEGGRTEDGEPLYIGRVWHDGAHTVGKVHPSHGCLYIPYDCREMSFPDYEVLILRT